jgi:heme exporter protein D
VSMATEAAKITDWVTAISAAISALSIVFLAFQTWLARRQLVDDHERSRRQTAVDLMATWTERLDQSTSATRKFVQALSREDTLKIVNRDPLTVPESKRSDLLGCLTAVPKAEAGLIQLDVHEVSKLRWQMLTYLNTLECVLTALHHNIADEQIMSAEFGYLVDPTKGDDACKDFRDAAGGRAAFPAIYEFIRDLEKKREDLANKRDGTADRKQKLGVL